MSNILFKDRDGQTPLPQVLQSGLKFKHIQNMGELDEYEEKNIAEGLAWLESCNEEYGTYNFWRKPHQIWPAFKKLEDDLKYWLDQKEIPFQEIAARFHEKIETIHPFVNGNGRFGRILVNYFCRKEREQIPAWGAVFKNDPKLRRQRYIEALDHVRQKGSHELLIKFMFS